MLLKCIYCRKDFSVQPWREKTAKFCSMSCSTLWRWKNNKIPKYRNQASGSKNSNWKGGIKKIHGYILILSPNHPNKDKQGYIREHRLVMENHLGRYLTSDEIVHHKNEVKNDNRLSNLLLAEKKIHDKIHLEERLKRWRKLRIKKICPICKKEFSLPRSLARVKTCSKSCGAVLRHR